MNAMIIFLLIHNCLVMVFLYSQVASVETITVKSVQNKKAGERFMYFQNKASLLYYSEKCACSQMCRFYVRFFVMVSNSAVELQSLL